MFDPWQLGLDSASNVVSLALPGGLWALLFVLAWEHGPFAESLGLDRKAFWLLLPGALLSSYALLPIAPISHDWVAVSFGGALLPLTVGALALRRIAPPAGRSLARFLGWLGAEAGAALLVVLPISAPTVGRLGSALGLGAGGASVLLVALVGVAVGGTSVLLARASPDPMYGRVAFLVGLSTGVLLLTFAGSSAIPGTGIVEEFPYFLVPPVAAGIVAGLLAPTAFPKEEGLALPGAFFATTVGVLLGADLLREPPLYGHGSPGLYAIGGAGVLDLVYLSGLLALAAAFLVHAMSGRGWAPVGIPLAPATPSAEQQLREAYFAGVGGDVAGSLRSSVAASRTSAAQARHLFGVAGSSDDRPWEGLPVPGWIVSDHANLEGVARSGTNDPREGFRGWMTARWLVLVGRELSLRRFATIFERLAAFAIDLAIVTAPALLLFGAIAEATPGGFGAVATNIPFNVAIVGAIAAALLYLTLAEAYAGTTVGKAALGLVVRDRSLRTPDGLAALVRNLPLAPILTFVAFGGAVALAVAIKGIRAAGTPVLGVSVPVGVFAGLVIVAFVVGAVALLGAFGVVAMALTGERQRVGDLWAGTWVVREATEGRARQAPAPGASSPPGEVRSG
ncbi:MAG: RDD family protein [Thermoplasmata archaeon]